MRKLAAGLAIGSALVAGGVSMAATGVTGPTPELTGNARGPVTLLAQAEDASSTEGGATEETGQAESGAAAEDPAAAGSTGTTEAPAEESAPAEAPAASEDAATAPAATDPAAPAEEAPAGEAPLDMAALAGSWVADEINGTPSSEGVVSWLRLTDAGRAQGQGGCNSYSGSYTLEEGVAAFGPFASTRRSCPEPQLSQEERFFAALGAVRGARVEDGKLMLLDEQGNPLVTLNRM